MFNGMKRVIQKRLTTHAGSMIVTSLLIIASVITVTFAWNDLLQHKTNPFENDERAPVVFLQKYLKDANGETTGVPIAEAHFYLYRKDSQQKKSSDEQIGGKYTTDENGQLRVFGLKPGDYYFWAHPPLFPYTHDIDQDGNEITEYEFSITEDMPKDMVVSVTAHSRRFSNFLKLEKTVKNADGSALTQAQLDQYFTFVATFRDRGAETEETYSYNIYDEKEDLVSENHKIKSGETLSLKHGQSAIFYDMLGGLEYLFVEQPSDGYVITSSNHQGTILENGAHASFQNTYVSQTEATGALSVIHRPHTGAMSAENDPTLMDLNLTFTILFSDGNKYPYSVDGVPGTLDEDGKFTLAADKTALFEDLPAGITYQIIVDDPEEEFFIIAQQEYGGQIVADTVIELVFQPIYVPTPGENEPENLTGNIAITKKIAGADPDLKQQFPFILEPDENLELSEPITYRINGGELQTLGDDGVFVLMHDQTAVFESLPAGLKYTVAESFTEESEYLATITYLKGVVPPEGNTSEATFVNVKSGDQDEDAVLTIKKVFWDDRHKDTETVFGFEVSVNNEVIEQIRMRANESREILVPHGSTYVIREISEGEKGYVVDSVLNGMGTAIGRISVEFSNRYVGVEQVEIPVKKSWDISAGSADNIPHSITVSLMHQDTIVDQAEISPDSQGVWKHIFEAPRYNSDWEEIQYSIREEPVESFATQISKGQDGFEIKNTYIKPASYAPTVKKSIVGHEPKTETTFQFTIKAENQEPLPQDTTLEIPGGAEKSFMPIQFTSEGVYNYTIAENKGTAKGYSYDQRTYQVRVTVVRKDNQLVVDSVAYFNSERQTPGERAEFVNEYQNLDQITVSVKKLWAGINPNQPSSVQVQLYRNGAAYGEMVTLNDANNWSHNWAGLDASHKWTVDEPAVPSGYKKTVIAAPENHFTIVNAKGEHTNITGSKTWRHGTNPIENRPTAITIHVKREGYIVAQKTVRAKDQWMWSFGLPKHTSDGRPIQYTIEEVPVDGYNTQVDGYNVMNTHTTYQGVEIRGEKTWNHGTNQSKRPESIVVQVKNGDKVVASKQITADDDWKWSFDLPKYDDNGQQINYTIAEANVPYYTHQVDGYNITNTFKGFDHPGDSPKTGDSNRIWVWVTVITLCAAGGVTTLLLKNKRQKSDIHQREE